MVGIARSKACYACRSRRKKCDEIRPTCGLCEKRGITCAYKTDLNIVFVDPGRKARSPETSTDYSTSKGSSPAETNSQALSPIDLPSSYLNDYFQVQLRGCLLEEYFPTATGRISSAIAWLAEANVLSDSDVLVNDALDALSYSNLERRTAHQNGNSTDRSRMLYGKTMSRLRNKITKGDDALGDGTLATVMILAAYEAQTAHKGDMVPWLSHVQASTTLVQIRGKRNSETEFGRKLFLGTRMTYLIHLIGTRKGLKEIPPLFDNLYEDPAVASYSKLFHILLALPSIIEQIDVVETTLAADDTSTLDSDVSILSYLCRDMDSKLSNWQSQLQELEGSETNLYWETPSELYQSLPADSEARIYPYTFYFVSIDVAQQMVLKWTSLFLVNSTLKRIQIKLQTQGHTLITLDATDAASERAEFDHHTMATNITRSLEYLTFPEMGLSTLNFLGLPMNMIYGYWNATKAQERFFFHLIFARLEAMNTGAGSFIGRMAKHGGGGPAFKKLLVDKEPVSSPLIVAP